MIREFGKFFDCSLPTHPPTPSSNVFNLSDFSISDLWTQI